MANKRKQKNNVINIDVFAKDETKIFGLVFPSEFLSGGMKSRWFF